MTLFQMALPMWLRAMNPLRKTIQLKIGERRLKAGVSKHRLLEARALPFLWPKELGDVALVHRDENGGLYRTNLPRHYTYADQDAWGYGGNGPTCLAQNVLFHFTQSEDLAARLAYAFCDEVIRRFPNNESCVMSMDFIQAWIEFHKSQLTQA